MPKVKWKLVWFSGKTQKNCAKNLRFRQFHLVYLPKRGPNKKLALYPTNFQYQLSAGIADMMEFDFGHEKLFMLLYPPFCAALWLIGFHQYLWIKWFSIRIAIPLKCWTDSCHKKMTLVFTTSSWHKKKPEIRKHRVLKLNI